MRNLARGPPPPGGPGPILALAVLLTGALAAQAGPARSGGLARLAFDDPPLRSGGQAEPLDPVSALLDPKLRDAWENFSAEAGGAPPGHPHLRPRPPPPAAGPGLPRDSG